MSEKSPESEAFAAAILAYLGETPQLVKTGEKGWDWGGVYDITRWEASDICREKARRLGEKALGGDFPGKVYRYATGRGCPVNVFRDLILEKLAELIEEEKQRE